MTQSTCSIGLAPRGPTQQPNSLALLALVFGGQLLVGLGPLQRELHHALLVLQV